MVVAVKPFTRGERITATRLNQLVSGVNEALAAPLDLDEGAQEQEVTLQTLQEIQGSRVSTTVRVTNPEDDDQYVDVARPTTIALRNVNTGELSIWLLENG